MWRARYVCCDIVERTRVTDNIQDKSDNEADYLNCLAEFSSIKDRSKLAEEQELGRRGLSSLQLHDNLWHVRKYFWALEIHLASSVSKSELELLIVFAKVRSGAADPMPWVLTVDYVLRKLWLHVKKVGSAVTAFTEVLFNELVMFSHGVVLNAYLCRFPTTHMTLDQTLVSNVRRMKE